MPSFGRGCYVDSTPLPNDIVDNPFNALTCHGVTSCSNQIRLALVLDEATGWPVWYDIIPGNVIDLSTTMNVIADVADTLDIEASSLVLDAGYVSKELIQAFHIGSGETFIARMPAKKDYPFKTLYWKVKDQIPKGRYEFVMRDHMYFGRRFREELFGQPEYLYVYVDKENALQRVRDFIRDHEDEYSAMTNREKDWYNVRFGYFVLISNKEEEPRQLLADYFRREKIEEAFKTSKEYLKILPLSKWTDQTVRGKLLHDIIDTIIELQMREKVLPSGLSVSRIIGKAQALMCTMTRKRTVRVEAPSKQVKEYYRMFDLNIPGELDLQRFSSGILEKM